MDGYARCVNGFCEQFGADRPLELSVETVETTAPEMANMVINRNTYLAPVDPTELDCPTCEQPCAITTGAAKVYSRMAPR